MRLKPRAWFLISLLLFAAAICMWQYAEKYAAAHRPVEKRAATAKTGALQSQQPPVVKAAAANAAAKRKSYRISNTTQTIAQLLHNSHALILRNALIDTEVAVGLEIPAHLRARGAPGSYLVQADRPLDRAFYAELSKAGVSYISYVPNNAALVKASPAQATNLAAQADVIVVLPYEPYYKLDSTLLPSAVEQQPQTNALSVTTFPGQRDAALAALTQLGAKLLSEDSSPFGPTLIVSVPAESLTAVAQLPLAQEIEAYTPRHMLNDLTRVQMGVATNTLLGTPTYLALSGLNVTVSLNDTGVDATHPDFAPASRLVGDPNNPGSLTDNNTGHGTHVAGIIAGNGSESLTVTGFVPGSITTNGPVNHADFRGKATNATLFVQALGESDGYLQTNAAVNLGPTNLIDNNSWGYNSTVYDMSAASYDAATRDALPNAPNGGQPLLFVFAAGDGGNGSGTINSPGTAKNVITVGASDSPRHITNYVSYDGGVTSNQVFLNDTDNSNTVADFSSSGNVDVGVEGTYGRFKPDVVAPGVFTISCRATSYVFATNEPYITDYPFPNQTVALNQTNANYPIYLPADTSQVVVVISSNAASPMPFPTNMLILATNFNPPTNVVSTNDYYVLSNNFTPGSVWFFAVAPPTNLPPTQQASAVSYNLNIYTYETNNTLTNYFYVVSNLNNVLTPWYLYQSGSSMSAGAVSGTLALMQEFLQKRMNITNPSPALLKAMLINGSRSLSQAGQPYDFNVSPLNANEQGWGMPNITNCLPASLTNTTTPSMVLIDQSTNNALATGQYQTYQISCTDTNATTNALRITLVWTDPPGNPAAGIALVNNLNLTVADNTGSNIYIGNNFLGGDIFTEISNPTNLPSGQNDNDVQNIYVNSAGNPIFTAAGDSINNVQNVYINPATGPINFPLTVTISGTRVNVNAVTTQTNNIRQDYALVMESDDRALASPLTIATNPIGNLMPVLVTVVSNGVPLLHQRVGANEPNLYMSNSIVTLTNGNFSQWHFFIFTNNLLSVSNATNVAFATFDPPNLSIPRSSSADIDLYVYPGSIHNFTNFIFNNFATFVQEASNSVGRTGTESIIFTNATFPVYYIGVKSEDQQAADFGFYGVAQQAPFSSPNGQGGVSATGTGMPVTIPDATSPQPALVFAFLVNPDPVNTLIRRVVVTNDIEYPSPDDLYGTLQFNGLYTVLNAYAAILPDGITNVYDDLQENPDSGTVVTAGFSSGAGGLEQYVGLNANGLWLLTEASRAIGQSGSVNNYGITVDLQQPLAGGFVITNCGGWYDGYIDVPNDATNLIITATIISQGGGSIGIYLTNFDNLSTSDYGSNNNVANGAILSLSTNNPVLGWPGSPPLSGGRWYYGIYNSSTNCLTLGITNIIQENLTPNLVQTYTNNTPIPLTTDGHTQSLICLTNVAAGQQVVSLQIGVRINDTNLDDLVLHLTSPQGTTVNLFEDRGGTNASNLGLTLTNGGTTNYVYTIFTENTNLTTTPIKFAPPPFATSIDIVTAILWSNSFETVSNGVYTTGAILEGWLVTNNVVTIMTTNGPALLTNDEVGIVTDPNGDIFTNSLVTNSLGTNYLALTSGHIIQTFGATNPSFTSANGFAITNGQPYQLVFYAKPMGITDWWPADDDADDIIGTNNGTPTNIMYDVGEVDRAFTFNGAANSLVSFGTNAGNFGTNDFTIDFWIKASSTTGTYAILENGNGECPPFSTNFFGLFLVSGAVLYYDPVVSTSFHSTNKVGDGVRYHHVALTRQGFTTVIYIDGAPDSTNTAAARANIDSTNALVASSDICGIPGFAGDLDELDLCNRALSPAEVYAIYHAGSLGKYSTNSILPNFDLTIDGISTNNIILTNASGGWQLFTNSFTANSDQVTVEFSGNAMGVLLDGIQLIQEPATNYNNYYLPEEPLTPFIGENPLGCWTLDVWDTRNDSSLPTNGTLLSWNMQVTTSSTNATLYVLTTNSYSNGYSMTVTNAPIGGMTYFAVDVPSYATYATNILTNVSGGPLTLYFDQTSLPTGGLPGDVALTNGITSGITSTNVLAALGAPPPLLPGQRYFLGVLNNGATPATFTIEVNFNVTSNNIIPLNTNAVPYPNQVGTNTNSIIISTNGTSVPVYYSFIVPTNAVLVTFQILNSTNGEVDLYASDGLPLPGPLDFDYASANAGTNDQFIVVTTNSVPVALPVVTNDVVPVPPSTWYLAAYNSATNTATNSAPVTNNYTIIATWVSNSAITIIPLTSGTAYTTNAPPGYPTNLLYSYTETTSPAGIQFTVTNLPPGAGNVELLAGFNVFPTPQDFYIGSFNPGTNAQLVQIGTNSIVTNLNGIWYLVVPNTSATNVAYSIEAVDINPGPVTNAPAIGSASVSAATGRFTLSWAASVGQTYQIQISTNLPHWTVLTNITTESTVGTYTDPTPVLSQHLRFYRLLQQ
jgi:subtilisin-like proprotein convertase family protein